MRKVLIALYVLVLAIMLSACAETGITQDDKKLGEGHYKMGLSYFSENNITVALKELFQAYKYNPDSVETNHLLGLAYLSKRKFTKSEEHLKKAIALNKDDFPKATNNLGVLYLQMERYDDALEQFKKSASNILYETPEFAYTNMGWAYYKKDDMVNAKKNYEKSIELEPRYSLAYYNMGILYFDLKKYDDAVTQYKKALKFFPNYLDAQYNLALTFFKKNDIEKAKEAFGKVVEIAPESKQAEESKGYLDLLK